MDGKINIPAGQAAPGMVLAEDVRDRSGRLLLSAGLPLREKHIRVLKTWGVFQVAVWTDSQPDADAEAINPDQRERGTVLDEMALKRAEAIMVPAFAHANLEHPIMQRLFQIAVERVARQVHLKDRP
ncbi:hypothetical protein SAMN05421693_10691 [Ectothiorhodospira magna]|uniref:Uncharacterized protein n=1 Tax=Ectothiorhodospira magna TaxID=867345 RepID=A0A1H9AUD5_9GAMM|nr:hypothetical protein [Ectothiorhodospira magna]SEP80412.1 hypothetical protein SAMN05421693_10691 [Ectothiorhodospira magna]